MPSRLAPMRDVGDLVAAVVADHHVLRARLDPLDGPAQPARGPHREDLLAVDLQLGAEAAADLGRDRRGRAPRDTPSMSARKRRRKCGTWVDDQIVTCPARSSASTARGSIAPPDVRWLTIRRSTTTSASAKPASRSPPPSDHSWTLFVPIDGVDEHLVAQRRLRVGHDRQRLVLDDDLLGGVHDGVAVLAEDDGDRIAHVLDLAAGQRPVLGGAHLDAGRHPRHRQRGLEVAEVLAGEDRDDVVAGLGAPRRRSRRCARGPPASARTPSRAGRRA